MMNINSNSVQETLIILPSLFSSQGLNIHESNKEARLEGRVKGKKMNKNNYGTHVTAIQYLDIALLLRPSQFWSLLGQE